MSRRLKHTLTGLVGIFAEERDTPQGKKIIIDLPEGRHYFAPSNEFVELSNENPNPDYPMYDKILPIFQQYMRKELAANYTKGGRNGPEGWLNVTENRFWISELYYHVGKLQAACKDNDLALIAEYTADIANLAMMVLDVKIDLLNLPLLNYEKQKCPTCKGAGYVKLGPKNEPEKQWSDKCFTCKGTGRIAAPK